MPICQWKMENVLSVIVEERRFHHRFHRVDQFLVYESIDILVATRIEYKISINDWHACYVSNQANPSLAAKLYIQTDGKNRIIIIICTDGRRDELNRRCIWSTFKTCIPKPVLYEKIERQQRILIQQQQTFIRPLIRWCSGMEKGIVINDRRTFGRLNEISMAFNNK